MAHRLLNRDDIDATCGQQRAKGVPKIMEAQRPDVGRALSAPEATTQRRIVQPATELVAEHEIIRSGEVLATTHSIQRRCGLVGQRNPPHAARLGGGLDPRAYSAGNSADPAKSTSRQQLALPQPGVGGNSNHLGALAILGESGVALSLADR